MAALLHLLEAFAVLGAGLASGAGVALLLLGLDMRGKGGPWTG